MDPTLVVVYGLSLVEYVQMILMVFSPIVPWSIEATWLQRLSRFILLGTSTDPTTFYALAELPFWFSCGHLGLAILLFGLASYSRCPLLKPQPSTVPRFDLATCILQWGLEWMFIPLVVQMSLPWRCVVAGFQQANRTFSVPDPLAACWTNGRLLRLGMGVGSLLLYWPVAFLGTIQLHSDANHPRSPFWSHYLYMRDHLLFKSVFAFVSCLVLMRRKCS